jgi:uncharacterized protein YndB with AHSA1/START domain
MATREIWHELLVHVPPAALYGALTDPSKIAHWWTTGARGDSTLGGKLEFWFGDYQGSVAEITALEPHELVRWHVSGGRVQDWLETDVEFRILQVEGRTILHFRHSNWREDAKIFPHCSLGWAVFLLSLKEFVETGKGRPYPYDLPINLWTPPASSSAAA